MFITPDNLNVINFEFTDYCNAACPMCSRFKWDGSLNQDKVNKNHTSLATLKERIPEKIIAQLHKVKSIATYGDPVMNPEMTDIYKWIRDINTNCKLEIHTNGGARNKEFWKQCADLDIYVVFSIDGLKDTNHLYRRNVQWDKLMDNAKAFIDAGGRAEWKFIIFKHNEHQVEEARTIAEQMGFNDFCPQYTDRFLESNWVTGETHDVDRWPVDGGAYFLEVPTSQNKNERASDTSVRVYEKREFDLQTEVVCKMASNQRYEVYIRANGDVQPCCMIGDLDVHEAGRLISDNKSVNINHTGLVEIIQGDFFRKLDRGINQGTVDRLKNCFYTCGVFK